MTMRRARTKYDAAILRILEAGPTSGRDVHAALSMARRCTIENALRSMRDRGLIHIKRWAHGRVGPIFPMWTTGPGKDAPKPTPLSKSEVNRNWRDRIKRERPAEYQLMLQRYNSRHGKRKPRADIAASWITP